MPMKRNRGVSAPKSVADSKSPGGFSPKSKHNERNVNAGGRYEGDAPGLTRDTTPRIVRGPGR